MTGAGLQLEKKGLVRQLTEVSRLLEVLGADGFRANAYAAAAFGPRHMNWMHAFFGLGVAIAAVAARAVESRVRRRITRGPFG